MSKRIASFLLAAMILLLSFAGCSSKKADLAQSAPSQGQTAIMDNSMEYGNREVTASETPKDSSVEGGAAPAQDMAKNAATALTSSSVANQQVKNLILDQRKVIRNANLSLEVDDFNFAYGRINSIISAFGYIQETNVSREKIYVKSEIKYITSGVIVIRIDKDRFDSTLSDIYGLGEVMGQNISADDVTDRFFDTESRLRLLRYEESRLEEYLKKISDPDVIFKTESRLTDIRHEIESLTGTLNKWNSLVQLSTITINMKEKLPESVKAEIKEKSYMEKLTDSFLGSIKSVVVFFGDLLIMLVQALPIILILGVFFYIIYIFYRKLSKTKSVSDKSKNEDNSI